MPVLFFTIASVLVGFSLGIGPAILVVIVGVPVADYYFVPPYANFGIFDKEDVILFVGFPSATLPFLCMIEWLRRTQHEAKLLGDVAKARHDILLHADKRRKLRHHIRSRTGCSGSSPTRRAMFCLSAKSALARSMSVKRWTTKSLGM